jgi:hypothetical protein
MPGPLGSSSLQDINFEESNPHCLVLSSHNHGIRTRSQSSHERRLTGISRCLIGEKDSCFTIGYPVVIEGKKCAITVALADPSIASRNSAFRGKFARSR